MQTYILLRESVQMPYRAVHQSSMLHDITCQPQSLPHCHCSHLQLQQLLIGTGEPELCDHINTLKEKYSMVIFFTKSMQNVYKQGESMFRILSILARSSTLATFCPLCRQMMAGWMLHWSETTSCDIAPVSPLLHAHKGTQWSWACCITGTWCNATPISIKSRWHGSLHMWSAVYRDVMQVIPLRELHWHDYPLCTWT